MANLHTHMGIRSGYWVWVLVLGMWLGYGCVCAWWVSKLTTDKIMIVVTRDIYVMWGPNHLENFMKFRANR